MDLAKARIEAADDLASGVESFLSSLPYMAPEAVAFQAKVKLAEPLADYRLRERAQATTKESA